MPEHLGQSATSIHVIGLEVTPDWSGPEDRRPIRPFCLDHLHLITEHDGPRIRPVWSGALVTDCMPCSICGRFLGEVAQERSDG